MYTQFNLLYFHPLKNKVIHSSNENHYLCYNFGLFQEEAMHSNS